MTSGSYSLAVPCRAAGRLSLGRAGQAYPGPGGQGLLDPQSLEELSRLNTQTEQASWDMAAPQLTRTQRKLLRKALDRDGLVLVRGKSAERVVRPLLEAGL